MNSYVKYLTTLLDGLLDMKKLTLKGMCYLFAWKALQSSQKNVNTFRHSWVPYRSSSCRSFSSRKHTVITLQLKDSLPDTGEKPGGRLRRVLRGCLSHVLSPSPRLPFAICCPRACLRITISLHWVSLLSQVIINWPIHSVRSATDFNFAGNWRWVDDEFL